ncbi:MAG TPA: pitrilysin family protein [Acidobacteriota bacterium]|nr:pitrilysin family protein [Acidobacteriota bacterium]
MKKVTCFRGTILLVTALALSGCQGGGRRISVGPDGYGKARLPNGLTVLVNHDETTSLTAARILIGGGVLTETSDNNGITNLMTKMLLKGNDSMSAADITERLEFLGASVSASCFRDYSAISFTSLTENFDEVLGIIARSVASPTFPEEELVKLKKEIEGDIKASDDSQAQASSKLFWRTAYGDQGYGLPTLGTLESITGITAGDIRQHYRKYVGAENVVFSVATDLPVERLGALIRDRFEGLRAGADRIPAPELTLGAEQTGFVPFDRNQSYIFMGVVLDHLEPIELPYVILLNEIMGNNVGSRLWYLRQKEKLAYAVYTQYTADRYGAVFRAAIGTDTAKVQQALSSLDREWLKLVADGVTPEELADAKVNMKNNLIYSIDRKSVRANTMAYYEYVGYNHRFVLDLIGMADGVALDDLNGFVGERFTDDKRFVSVVGKR